jgi:hypothetical protein
MLFLIQISELLSYYKIVHHPQLKKQREKYISLSDDVIFVDIPIAKKAAELRRLWKAHSGKTLKLPNASYCGNRNIERSCTCQQ